MCDYSLEMYASRPAQEGEQYQTVRFPTGSVGLSAAGDTSKAICVACDTRLTLENIPVEVQKLAGVGPTANVTFVSIPHGAYRDGVAFDTGKSISLQVLGAGVRASLVPTARSQPEALLNRIIERVPETV